MRSEAGAFVYVARSSGQPNSPPVAMPMPVQVMFALKDRLVVRAEGIAPGDLLVVEGNERLMPMTPVMPSPRSPSGTAISPLLRPRRSFHARKECCASDSAPSALLP